MAIRLLRFALFTIAFFFFVLVRIPVNAQSRNAVIDAVTLQEIAHAVPNFGIVSPVLLRGGQPRLDRLDSLKRAGIKTIIDLRDGQKDIDIERAYADKLGLRFVSIPLSVFKSVSKDKVEKFLAVVRNPENQPVLVHCRQGQDRCGTMVAMYRLLEQSWTPDRAYDEMLKFGFHPIFRGLSQSVFSLAEDTERTTSVATN